MKVIIIENQEQKTIKKKIASAQMRLTLPRNKEKSLTKKADTHLKIILGAEVALAEDVS